MQSKRKANSKIKPIITVTRENCPILPYSTIEGSSIRRAIIENKSIVIFNSTGVKV
jgi:hypothetical protein